MEYKKVFNPDRSEEVDYSFRDYPVYISEGKLSMCPNLRFPSHWHDDVEFVAVKKGEMDYNVNGKIIRISQNEGIFVNSKQLHFGFSDEKKECEFVCVLFHPRLLSACEAFERDFISPVLGSEIAQMKLSADTKWQEEILRLILKSNELKRERTAPLRLQSLFGYIWSLIYENVSVFEGTKCENPSLDTVKSMVKFINTAYREQITLFDIASAGKVGESKCCKLFRQYLNTTPNAYLRLYRLEKASELLKTDTLSITQIANEVGFNGSSYFTESFKAVYGITPREYRARTFPSELYKLL